MQASLTSASGQEVQGAAVNIARKSASDTSSDGQLGVEIAVLASFLRRRTLCVTAQDNGGNGVLLFRPVVGQNL